ncbi:UNKNOWN [Stylonychia lemnae]|uniref:Uncharacterized protein n=1 Tax=Stylonychia lemnae TaxID=5949 RepID=A0A078AJ84_STYLE|nr:UNKNOWN [Stylonychia lemnae]|eukprot:CDW80863.1 UNKNOWN [Stylonychia lemnae]
MNCVKQDLKGRKGNKEAEEGQEEQEEEDEGSKLKWDEKLQAIELPIGYKPNKNIFLKEGRVHIEAILKENGIMAPKVRERIKTADGSMKHRQELMEIIVEKKEDGKKGDNNKKDDGWRQQTLNRGTGAYNRNYYERTFTKVEFMRTEHGATTLITEPEKMRGLVEINKSIADAAVEVRMLKKYLDKANREQTTSIGGYFLGKNLFIKDKICWTFRSICKALIWGLDTELVEKEIFSGTNLCLFYAWGLCIHPECLNSHDQDYKGILFSYKQARNQYTVMVDGKPTRVQDRETPIEKLVKKDLERLNTGLKVSGYFSANLSQYQMTYRQDYTRVMHGLCIIAQGKNQGMSAIEMRKKKDCLRIIRQYIMGQAEINDLAVRYAFIQIFHDKRAQTQQWPNRNTRAENQVTANYNAKMDEWMRWVQAQYMRDVPSEEGETQQKTLEEMYEAERIWSLYTKAQFVYNPSARYFESYLRIRGNLAPYSGNSYLYIDNQSQTMDIYGLRWDTTFNDSHVLYLDDEITTMKQYVSNRRFWEERREDNGRYKPRKIGNNQLEKNIEFYEEYYPMVQARSIEPLQEACMWAKMLKKGLIMCRGEEIMLLQIANQIQGKFETMITTTCGTKEKLLDCNIKDIVGKNKDLAKILAAETIRIIQQLENLVNMSGEQGQVIHKQIVEQHNQNQGQMFFTRINLSEEYMLDNLCEGIINNGGIDSIMLRKRINENNTPGLEEARELVPKIKGGITTEQIRKLMYEGGTSRRALLTAIDEALNDEYTSILKGDFVFVKIDKGIGRQVMYVVEIGVEAMGEKLGISTGEWTPENVDEINIMAESVTEQQRKETYDRLKEVYNKFNREKRVNYKDEIITDGVRMQKLTWEMIQDMFDKKEILEEERNRRLDRAFREDKIISRRRKWLEEFWKNQEETMRQYKTKIRDKKVNAIAQRYEKEKEEGRSDTANHEVASYPRYQRRVFADNQIQQKIPFRRYNDTGEQLHRPGLSEARIAETERKPQITSTQPTIIVVNQEMLVIEENKEMKDETQIVDKNIGVANAKAAIKKRQSSIDQGQSKRVKKNDGTDIKVSAVDKHRSRSRNNKSEVREVRENNFKREKQNTRIRETASNITLRSGKVVIKTTRGGVDSNSQRTQALENISVNKSSHQVAVEVGEEIIGSSQGSYTSNQ